MMKLDLYHFKVMQLSTYKDGVPIDTCKVRFHFLFHLVRWADTTEDELSSFDWDVSEHPMQRLYLSHDTTRLMMNINNVFAMVFRRHDIDAEGKKVVGGPEREDRGQQVRWDKEFQVKRFPRHLAQYTSVPFIFSPNFTYQLDFNYGTKALVVRQTSTQEVYLELPTDLINTDWSGVSERMSIHMIFTHLKWESETSIRIVTQSRLDCILQMQCHEDPLQRSFKLLSLSKIDNLFTDQVRMDSHHSLVHPFSLEAQDVLERLIRMNQRYKTTMQHGVNLRKNNLEVTLLELIHKVDYQQAWGILESNFVVEKSFTWLDWLIMNQAINDPNFDLRTVDVEQKIQLCFNIFPTGRGILHYLAATTSGKHKNSSEAHFYFPAKDLFDVTRAEN